MYSKALDANLLEADMSRDANAAVPAAGRRTVGEPRRRRDPARRRQAIIDAAAELVTEVGVASLTHRLVAARAEVPLGSTTQYFATLDALRAAALARLADDVQAYVDQVAASMDEAISMLARGIHEYLSDDRLVRADAMLSASAVLDQQLRPLTDGWFGGLANVLSLRLGAAAAERVVIFIGGATWHAALNDAPPSLETIAHSLRALRELADTDGTATKTRTTAPRGRRKDS